MLRGISKALPLYILVKEYVTANKKREKLTMISALFIMLYFVSIFMESMTNEKTIIINKETDYQKTRLIGNSYGNIYKGKERLLEGKMNRILEGQKKLNNSIKEIKSKTIELEEKIKDKEKIIEKTELRKPIDNKEIEKKESLEDVRVHQANFDYRSSKASLIERKNNYSLRKGRTKNRTIISFPVKSIRNVKSEGVVLPTGSYVKAKLMTGIEAPEGKTYPVLLQLDFAHIIPNDRKLDLVGCFMIAKASGSLSTERVQMQAVKLSCVSKNGKMFERKINGFTADGGDNSFGVIGSVNTKQNRVAAMAFLSSVVEGVGNAIQMAQTTQSSNAVGGGQSVISGDQAKYIAAGGVGNAAGQVTQWYLKQAQSLLPTINVGSGKDVWIVMADKVTLPNDYFSESRSKNNETVYSYFTNILY